ncbi:ATP/ADP-transporter [Pseudoscourfieldia marina]
MLSSRVSLRTSRVAAVAPRARVAQRSAPRVSAVATPAPAGEPSNNNSNKLSIVQSSRKASSIVTKTSSGDAAASEPEFLGIAKSTMMKVVPLTLMMFCILFNYTILRDTKDVLVVTAPGSGAEIIPFLKTYVNLPAAIGFAAIYARMSNFMGREQLFYTILFPFIAFFGAFAFIMYPARDFLHPTEFCVDLLEKLGPKFMGPLAILRNWTYCAFYVAAELWGSVVVSVLFWGFANQIMEVKEAKQFYPLFGLIANVALIFSGQAVRLFSAIRADLPPGVDGWGLSLKGLMGMVVIGGFCVAGIYWAVNKYVLPNVPQPTTTKKKKEKLSMGIGESVTFLAKSSYVRDLATLVVAYGISINLVEVTWKSKIKAQYPDPNDYSMFMGNFSTATGTVTFMLMIISRFIFGKFGWGVAAVITPTVILLTGAVFFSLILLPGAWDPVLAALGFTPLFMAVLVGAAQNIFSKGSKYSLFDPCKEMAYIPLDEETKVKGKAAIDVICNPLGKSGGSLVQQFMIFTFGSLAASTPYLGGVLLVIVIMWLKAAASLNVQFEDLQKQRLAEAAEESTA